jgi:hypothetical protein
LLGGENQRETARQERFPVTNHLSFCPSLSLTMHDGVSAASPTAYYEQRLAQLSTEETGLAERSERLSRFRGLTFLPALGFALYAWLSDQPWSIWYLPAAVFFVAFVLLVGKHEQLLSQLEVCRERLRLNEAQQARRRRDWDRIPAVNLEAPPSHVATARDLDVCGRASLLHWLSLAQTPMGQALMRDWLLTPADPDEIAARQEAVRRLAPDGALREELQLRGRLLSLSGHGPASFLSWAERPAWLGSRPLLLWASRLISLTVVFAFATLLLIGPSFPLGVLLACLAVGNLILNVVYVPVIHEQFNIVASRQNDVDQYRAAFELFTQLPDDCRWLASLKNKLGEDASEPLRQLDHLARRVRFAAARHSAIWGLPYVVLQWIVLWDFHVLWFLEGWQQTAGHHAREWFLALAELEAILSLSAVAHDNPDWAFPDVSTTHPQFDAAALGHPLIADDHRVANDVTLGPAGTFLLVSGSNMSGKSTLLRSVGVNTLLAQAGSPVCALRCHLPPLDVATSMRVGDSLADGVSFYMAELKRLKTVVDHADQLRKRTDRTLLFLLDEILLGTNSAERRIAVVHVVQHLVQAGAIGAISTHDLELAASPALAAACQAVHFREQIEVRDGKRQMTFDYQMRPGVATTTNALKLLELVGLGVVGEGQLEP